MPNISKWNDFLMLIGIIPLDRPKQQDMKYERVGYPYPYLEILSDRELQENHRKSRLMEELYKQR